MSPFDLSPWDQLTAFGSFSEIFFPSANANSLIAPADNRRAILAINNGGSSVTQISTSPTAAQGQGWTLFTGEFQLYMTTFTHGPLVTKAWYMGAGSGTFITVFSYEVNTWDDSTRDALANIRPAKIVAPPAQITTAPGVGGRQGVIDYWRSKMAQILGGK